MQKAIELSFVYDIRASIARCTWVRSRAERSAYPSGPVTRSRPPLYNLYAD